MNNRSKLYFVLICIICQHLISCQESPKNIFLGSNTEVINFERSETLSGKQVFVENFVATNLHVIDTFIVFMTPQLDLLYSIVSTETYNHLGNFVNKGNGPSELLFAMEPLSAHKTGSDVTMSLYDFHNRNLGVANLVRIES